MIESLIFGLLALSVLCLYILLQLETLFFPLAITAGIGYWAYKAFIDKNPRVCK